VAKLLKELAWPASEEVLLRRSGGFDSTSSCSLERRQPAALLRVPAWAADLRDGVPPRAGAEARDGAEARRHVRGEFLRDGAEARRQFGNSLPLTAPHLDVDSLPRTEPKLDVDSLLLTEPKLDVDSLLLTEPKLDVDSLRASSTSSLRRISA